MTLQELKELLEAEAIEGAIALSKAISRQRKDKVAYWTAYVEARERMIVLLSELTE